MASSCPTNTLYYVETDGSDAQSLASEGIKVDPTDAVTCTIVAEGDGGTLEQDLNADPHVVWYEKLGPVCDQRHHAWPVEYDAPPPNDAWDLADVDRLHEIQAELADPSYDRTATTEGSRAALECDRAACAWAIKQLVTGSRQLVRVARDEDGFYFCADADRKEAL